ncbi:MFS transporter [Clostridium thermarum]|uniref:MFS transporter n=1 Tax=Clostridium thermarum TaxID=1716543 RepID=UPI0011248798|nr:MFS transporter [Clostridium thermarum]
MRKLGKDAVIFIFVQALFTLSTALSATFVNVYMWRLTSDVKYIVFQNILSSITIVLMFISAGFISRKSGITSCIRLGILFNLLFYIAILLLREKTSDYIVYLGVLSGGAVGFYYYGINTLIYHYTNSSNRPYYFGVSGALAAIMSTIAPVISGYIIVSKEKLQGYYVVFFISFILFLAAVLLSYCLTQIKEFGEYKVVKILLSKKDKAWKKLMAAKFLMGFRDGSFGLLLGLLVYMIFQNELNMGKLTTVTSILSIGATYIIGRFLNKKNQKKIFRIGALIIFCSTLILVIWSNFIGVVANSLLNALFTCLWTIPFNSIIYELIDKTSQGKGNVGDYMSALEVPVVFGRVISLLIFLALNLYFDMRIAIRIVLPLLSSTIFFMYLILTFKKGETKQKESK